MKESKRILRYLKGSQGIRLWYPRSGSYELVGFVDADYARYLVDKKSTSRMTHFLGPCLVSWAIKKYNLVALSTAEAEYVAATSCCAQLMWIKQQLEDYDILCGCIPIYFDNTSTINIAKNPIQHKRIKQIDIR